MCHVSNKVLSLQLSSPQFAERLGMYVTLGVPCYSKDEVLLLQIKRQSKATDSKVNQSIYHSFTKCLKMTSVPLLVNIYSNTKICEALI